jgi:hypothetical protein
MNVTLQRRTSSGNRSGNPPIIEIQIIKRESGQKMIYVGKLKEKIMYEIILKTELLQWKIGQRFKMKLTNKTDVEILHNPNGVQWLNILSSTGKAFLWHIVQKKS